MKKKKDKLNEDFEKKAFQEEQAAEKASEELAANASDETQNEPDLMKRMTELEQENQELKDKYLRSMAEFENYRRRSIAEKSDWIKLATQKLALEICDVMDNFERALNQVEEAAREDAFVKGVTQIEQQLRGVLGKEGVCRIDALGKEFDPALHEALAHIPSEYEANLVAAVIQNGYTMHDKVLRPVRVAVSSGKHEANQAETEPPAEDKPSSGNGSDSINIEIK
ncbi:MAG TPA: nucleotide exchange factor GrpE [Candidatus Syntrophosphaera sp.]|nr:nucleotide exchange factor GrpE [Candidatus Syntrophosphaera sp.]